MMRTRRLLSPLAKADKGVAGALEATITLEYEIPSVARMVGMGDIDIDYTRSVFLIS